MKHTIYENYQEEKITDAGEVIKWLQDNIQEINDKTPLGVDMHHDRTIKRMEILKSISNTSKNKIVAKFPELENKEIDE
jgi:hypothetical protein